MVNNTILADLERALQLLKQVDEKDLDFFPDPNVSPDIIALTDITEYPTQTHMANVMARIDAVIEAGDKLETRGASDYVTKIIFTCIKLAPPND